MNDITRAAGPNADAVRKPQTAPQNRQSNPVLIYCNRTPSLSAEEAQVLAQARAILLRLAGTAGFA